MTLRVLHIGKFYPPHHGGMEVFLEDLITEQRNQGIDARAIVHGKQIPGDPVWLTRVPVQFQLIFAPVALGLRSAIRLEIERFQPNILHLHLPNNGVFWCLTLVNARRIPWVVHWHSDVVLSKFRKSLAIAYAFYRPFEQAVLTISQKIIATSGTYLSASEPLQPWLRKCTVVPLGLPALDEPEITNTQNAWRVPGHFRLLSIGRLAYYKGFETLIQAAFRTPQVELLIVGDGELRAELQQLLENLATPERSSRVRLIGSVSDSDKHALLATCDLFCLASKERTEAFGLVLLEAMQHGKPCLVSKLEGSGMPWIVETSCSGWTAAPENVKCWQMQIERLRTHQELRMQMGNAGRRAMETKFSIASVSRSIAAQYALLTPISHENPISKDRPLIVIPARNEALTIGKLLQSLKAAGWFDVLVIDDQSDDGTGEIARSEGAVVLTPVLALGAWGAMQTGIRYALQKGYSSAITMDADGQHEVAELPLLIEAVPFFDVVIGAFPERASKLRHIAWAWFRQLAGFELRDLTSGFRYYNRDAMSVATSDEATMLDYQDLGTLLLVRQAGLRIGEVPVSMNMRISGKSRIFNSWLSVARYMVVTTLLCLSQWTYKRQHKYSNGSNNVAGQNE